MTTATVSTVARSKFKASISFLFKQANHVVDTRQANFKILKKYEGYL